MKFKLIESAQDIKDELWQQFKQATDKEIIDVVGGVIPSVQKDTPMFVTRNGDIIGVKYADIDKEAMILSLPIHADYVVGFLYNEFQRQFPDESFDETYKGFFDERREYGREGSNFLTNEKGWVRLNPGTTNVEKRFYMVLPLQRPTQAQWDAIESFLEAGEEMHKQEVLVFGENGDASHFYSLYEYTPEEIVAKLKRFYASGIFYESFDFIPHLYSENDENEKKIKEVVNKFRSMSEDDLIRKYGGVTSTIGGGSSGSNVLIVTPKGKIIDVDSVVGVHDTMHIDYIVHILYYILQDMYGDNQDLGLLFDTEDGIDEMASAELEHLRSNGWITINTGEGVNEDRFYGVFPSREEPRPTSSQWDSIEKILEYGYDSGKEEFMAYFDRGNKFHSYDLKSDFPEDIIKKMKRYYASGNLYEEFELNEVYPNKGESKEDFISRFMKVTAKEYPDKEQRFAVANSYWDRRNKKGVSETFDVDGNLYNPSKYNGIEINDNFKKWFQKGGITDPYHDPLIVYHGSRYDFDSFVPNSYAGEFPDAVYFTDNKKIADTYGNTKEYFIRMQNPYYINARKKSFNDFYDEMLYEFNYAKDNGYDGVVVRDIKDDSIQRGSRLIGTTYAIFDEYNVKSVANSGAWDENTSNVYEDFAGETDSEGNPLTEQQINFFHNSTIRNQKSQLQIMYHGSPAKNIQIFDSRLNPQFFTKSIKYADEYDNDRNTGEPGRIYKVYLNITKPFDLSTDEQLNVLRSMYLPWLVEKGYKLPTPDVLKKGDNVSFAGLADDLYVFLRSMYRQGKLDYDGIIVNEGLAKTFDEEYDASVSYVPLFENQIKSITNKNPTNSKNINEDMKSGNITVYRVGQVNDFSGGLFFTDDLSYFDHSATGYIKKDAVAYKLDLNKAKVIDIVNEWNLIVNSWESIEQTEEFFNSKGFHYYDYLEDIDYDDKNARHYVITDTDSLAKWAGENGYDVCIIRDVYNNYGQKYNEYVVYRKDLIEPVHNK